MLEKVFDTASEFNKEEAMELTELTISPGLKKNFSWRTGKRPDVKNDPTGARAFLKWSDIHLKSDYASVTSLSSSGGRSYTETTTSPSSSPTLQIKQEPFSQQESSSHPTKSNSKQQQQHSLKSPSGCPTISKALARSLSNLSSGAGGIVCVCGVKFSSTSNLEAHRLFYCSHRQANTESRSERKENSPTRDSEEETHSPSGSKLLKCPHCSYTTTHKLSLNGHMNIHTNPEDSGSQSSKSSSFSSAIDPRALERYCTDCDIQFSSIKNYRVHKANYCQTRHVLKGSKSPAREESAHSILSTLGSALGQSGGNAGQPILALPTNPVLLLPYSMVAGAQLLPPHILPQLGAAFVLPNGQVHPIPSASTQHSNNSATNAAMPPLLSPGAVAAAAATAAIISASSNNISSSTLSSSVAKMDANLSASTSQSKNSKEEESSSKRRGEGESPLDLTTYKRPKLAIKTDLLSDEEKENRQTINSYNQKSPFFGGGEFEGKLLLSSPPRISPSSDDDEINLKSQCPTSVASSLSSPRGGAPESPRPSTSALSASRSPSHTSPGASASAQALSHSLPPGFPSHLVNSLDSLSTSLPLASLQCLQSLQNVPRELALKLINPELLVNGLPPVMNPPVIVKQGEAKCNECNIVFYKEESLQIHKKHYCSARETNKSEEERNKSPPSNSEAVATPLRSPVAVADSVPSSSSTTTKESSKPAKPLLQFICTACGIKFSSPDNLAAHQTYYCPKREGVAEESNSTKGVWRCPRCRVVMAETMQAAHQCVSPSPAPSHGWKCPCCHVLSPTAAAAQKHLETHAGIKAFRCKICGYRGNTLRGMRTHIRMHFEKRSNDLQEESFIACILEDEDQRVRSSNVSNEARKMIESTRILLENTAFSTLLGDGAALSEQVEPPLTCIYCPFITPSRTTLLQHLTIVHKIVQEFEMGQEEDEPSARSGSESDSKPSSSPLIPNGSSSCYCQICKVSFSLLETYVAHKRFNCARPESRTPPETTVQ
ncbi:Zinc finger protein ush [Armadillidium nasatum]|uniref:Zinc finger protein ush n=1 Tax=Armadillidium nasatum TaxID=96803 RepID=A0A5N5SLN2_9CRUS|nr:Zinc finger protein ush [Armadillidium nasatum]